MVPSMRLFNTEKREKEKIISSEPLKIYTCGPTVYDYAHIGNFRTYVVEDLLRRALKFFQFRVIQVMNITDIDDKTLRGALREKVSLKDFTDAFIRAFFEDLQHLRIEKVEYYPRATEYIPSMIEIINKLLTEGMAYRGGDGSIYYNIHTFSTYGRLSHLPLEQLQRKEEGVIEDEYGKENVADFVLWKAFDPQRDGKCYWESPFGRGRPGWHIECSAMALNLLGPTIDIHAGGVDNIFPHHENEIAQSEAYTRQPFVKHWLHVEHLLVDHQKMSKSLGNFFTLRDLMQQGYSGVELRYLFLQTHYRTPLNFTFANLKGAMHSLERLRDFILRIRELKERDSTKQGVVNALLKTSLKLFAEALAEDLNVVAALAVLFDFVREVNALCDQGKISGEEAQKVLKFLHHIDQVLGILPLEEESMPPRSLQNLLVLRQRARELKEWEKADQYRDQIIAKGYLIEDTPCGARLKKRSVHEPKS